MSSPLITVRGMSALQSIEHSGRIFARQLGRVMFPAHCPGCNAPGEPVCAACVATMRPAVAAVPPVGIDRWAAPFAYDHVVRELIARVKYRNQRHALGWLADRAAAHFVESGCLHEIETEAQIAWVPTTKARRSARGFDHAELIAGHLSATLGFTVVDVFRRATSVAQTGQPLDVRRSGPTFDAISVAPQSLILVDDVATTGATLRNAARAARGVGTNRVVALTIARTPPPGTFG